MLVLTSGGVLLMGNRPVCRLEGFQIFSQMMGLINVELTRACSMGHLDHRDCPYHYNLRDYVGLAVRAMRICCWRLGGVDALPSVGGKVEQAGLLREFVSEFRNPEWDFAQFSRMATSWVGMVFFLAVILCI